MKIIPYLEISSKIMTLIESAEKELFIVSPYVNISDWEKMKKCLIRAKNRNVRIRMYVRKNAQQDLSALKEIGIIPILIENLHAKLYVNEKYGIVTSQNLVAYSDINSIDIAYKTENIDERTELIEFINKSIQEVGKQSIREINIINDSKYEDRDLISKHVLGKLHKQFENKYLNTKFVETNSYLFSGNLFYFADVMISSVYTLKFSRENTESEKLIERIGKIDFNPTNKFKVNLRTHHSKFYYLEFEPYSKINFVKLISDFEAITDNILEISQ